MRIERKQYWSSPAKCGQSVKQGLLIFVRAEIAECRMFSLSIVEDFNVVEQAGLGLIVCQIVFSMHLLILHTMPAASSRL